MRRFDFLGRRMFQLVFVVLGITVITFFLLRLIPGDPAIQILGSRYTAAQAALVRARLGIDRPLWGQYTLFVSRLFHGSFGYSFYYNESAGRIIFESLSPTLFLVAYAAAMAAIFSIPVGVISALRRGGIFDQASRIFFLVAFSLPAFWLGIVFILIFSVNLTLFPINGYGSGFVGHLYYLFLPALTIALPFSTVLVRTLRASMLSILRADFVDTARIKGISRFTILRKHVLRNAIISIVVVFGVNLAFLIGGTVLVENVFSVPGLGTLLVSSVSSRDYPVVQGITLIFAFLIVGVNLLTDVVQAALDPRVAAE